MIYTHGHIDHTSGIRLIHAEAETSLIGKAIFEADRRDAEARPNPFVGQPNFCRWCLCGSLGSRCQQWPRLFALDQEFADMATIIA